MENKAHLAVLPKQSQDIFPLLIWIDNSTKMSILTSSISSRSSADILACIEWNLLNISPTIWQNIRCNTNGLEITSLGENTCKGNHVKIVWQPNKHSRWNPVLRVHNTTINGYTIFIKKKFGFYIFLHSNSLYYSRSLLPFCAVGHILFSKYLTSHIPGKNVYCIQKISFYYNVYYYILNYKLLLLLSLLLYYCKIYKLTYLNF